jgi:hypothetical protein
MFVIDPNVSPEDRDKIKTGYKQLKSSLNNYKKGSADYKRIQRALTRLGGIGVANGITVTVGKTLNSGATAETLPTASTNMGRRNATVNSTITFNNAKFNDQDVLEVAGTLGHEATHAADFDVLARTYNGPNTGDAFLTAFNAIRYSSEFEAYMLEGAVHQALAPDKEYHNSGNIPVAIDSQLPRTFGSVSLWNPSWATLDAAQIQRSRSRAVNSILMTPKKEGGSYELSPPK